MQTRLKAFVLLCFTLAFSCTAFSKPSGGSTSGGPNSTSGNTIKANPNDYYLAKDFTLETSPDPAIHDTVTYPAGTLWYKVPDVARLRSELAQNSYSGIKTLDWAKRVLLGYDLMTQTNQLIGPASQAKLFKDPVMNCSTCHAQGGTVPYAWPFFRTYTHFGVRNDLGHPPLENEGELYASLAYWRDTITVNKDCGINCAGNGYIPTYAADSTPDNPKLSAEMDALAAWIEAVRDGIYAGEGILIPEFKLRKNVGQIPGARIPNFDAVATNSTFKADPAAGKTIYDRKCASCHAKDGLGKLSSSGGYTVPPVAGSGSHTRAGGPYMVPVLAAFIKKQMPLSQPDSLTEQQAINVAAYINGSENSAGPGMPRDNRWWQDYYFDHDPCSRPAWLPLDVGVAPFGYENANISAGQFKYGPWKPIIAWLTGSKHNPPPANRADWSCRDYPENTPYSLSYDINDQTLAPYRKLPILTEDFDFGFICENSVNALGCFQNPGYEPPRR